LLTRRTHIVPVLVVLLVFPAAALAAGGAGISAGSGEARVGLSDAVEAAPLAVLHRSSQSFERTVHTFARRIRAERRAAARRRYAHLPGGVSIETLDVIASCESGGDPTAVSSDGSYRGKYQFDLGTWESVGGHGDPATASEAEQDYRAALLYAQSGSSSWPICG
jgi:hypothetical protein